MLFRPFNFRLFSSQTTKGVQAVVKEGKSVSQALAASLGKSFDPKMSKYSGERVQKNLLTQIERKDAPAYL